MRVFWAGRKLENKQCRLHTDRPRHRISPGPFCWRTLCKFKCKIHFFVVSVLSHFDFFCFVFWPRSAQSRLIQSCFSFAAPRSSRSPCGPRALRLLQSAVAGAARSSEPFKLTTDLNVSFGDYLAFPFGIGTCDHMLKCQKMSTQSSRREGDFDGPGVIARPRGERDARCDCAAIALGSRS